MGCNVSSFSVGGGMTSSTISVNFNDTAQKTVFTATEKCILKLRGGSGAESDFAKFKLNDTNIADYYFYYSAFDSLNTGLANLLTPTYRNVSYPKFLILYLEEGDTVYANRTSSNAFTATFYSAVFTF